MINKLSYLSWGDFDPKMSTMLVTARIGQWISNNSLQKVVALFGRLLILWQTAYKLTTFSFSLTTAADLDSTVGYSFG